MAETLWEPCRKGLRYVIRRRLWSDAFGAAYEWWKPRLGRDAGRVTRFWTLKRAQEFADYLNDNGIA